MRISIIGANGFLAKSIASYFNKKNIDIIIIGRSKPVKYSFKEFYRTDILIDKIPYEEISKSDIIIYAAGAGIQSNLNEHSSLIYDLNVSVPVKICNELNKIKFKGAFVSFGSYFEIGPNLIDHKYNEAELINSINQISSDYSISKRMFTRFISSSNFNFKNWHFILPTIYGEHENKHRLIPYIINSIKEKRKLQLTSGTQIRQYIYVDEIAEIIFKSHQNKLSAGIYNVEGAETFSVKDLVFNLHELLNKSCSDKIFGKVNRADTQMKVLQLDGRKLCKTINFTPKIKISDIYNKYE